MYISTFEKYEQFGTVNDEKTFGGSFSKNILSTWNYFVPAQFICSLIRLQFPFPPPGFSMFTCRSGPAACPSAEPSGSSCPLLSPLVVNSHFSSRVKFRTFFTPGLKLQSTLITFLSIQPHPQGTRASQALTLSKPLTWGAKLRVTSRDKLAQKEKVQPEPAKLADLVT